MKKTYIAVASQRWPGLSTDEYELNLETYYVDSTEKVNIDFKYVYRVNGKEYQSSNWKLPFNIKATLSRLYQRAAEIEKDRKIKIYYCPEKPELSVLEPGVSLYDFIGLLAFFTFIFLEFIIIVLLSKPGVLF